MSQLILRYPEILECCVDLLDSATNSIIYLTFPELQEVIPFKLPENHLLTIACFAANEGKLELLVWAFSQNTLLPRGLLSKSAIFYNTSQGGNKQVIEYLEAFGYREYLTFTQNAFGNNPGIEALVANGHLNTLKWLVGRDYDLTNQDLCKLSCKHNRPRILEWAWDYDSVHNVYGMLHITIATDNLSLFKWLTKRVNYETDKDTWFLCCQCNAVRILEYLWNNWEHAIGYDDMCQSAILKNARKVMGFLLKKGELHHFDSCKYALIHNLNSLQWLRQNGVNWWDKEECLEIAAGFGRPELLDWIHNN